MRKSQNSRRYTSKIGRRGVVVIPAPLRKSIGLDEGDLIVVESTDDGLIIRPAVAFPLETYSPRRKAEFLLSNAVDAEEYSRTRAVVRSMGLDPDEIDHIKPKKQKTKR